MRKQSSKDINQVAFNVVQQATGQIAQAKPEKNPAAVELAGQVQVFKKGKGRTPSIFTKQPEQNATQ